MKNIKAVVFDMDGVLLDSEKVYDECWFKASADFSINPEKAVALRRECLGFDDESCIKKLKSFYGHEFAAEKFYMRTNEIARNIPIEKKYYAQEILIYLSRKKYTLFLATSNTRDYAVKILKENSLWDFFTIDGNVNCVFGDSVRQAKPNPEIYRLAVEKSGFFAGECLAVEDSPAGIESAFGAGLYTVMVPDRVQPDDNIKKMCNFIFKDLKEIETIL